MTIINNGFTPLQRAVTQITEKTIQHHRGGCLDPDGDVATSAILTQKELAHSERASRQTPHPPKTVV